MKQPRFFASRATLVLCLVASVATAGGIDAQTRRRSNPGHGAIAGSVHHAKTRLHRRRRALLTDRQRQRIQRWHARADPGEVRRWLAQSPPPLVLRPVGRAERFVLVPDPEGRFDDEARGVAERALADRTDGSHVPVHPRLIELVYRAVRRFRAPYVHVISGYRGDDPASRHAHGRAIDFVLPGVSDQRLAAFLRPQGFVGVGIYPTSGFVHLDVRARSYFWSDASGPGQPNRERRILRTLGARFDRVARARGVEPVDERENICDDEHPETELAPPVEIAPSVEFDESSGDASRRHAP